jgi:hypothetical protein
MPQWKFVTRVEVSRHSLRIYLQAHQRPMGFNQFVNVNGENASTSKCLLLDSRINLTMTVRTTPPLAPSRAMARETALTTNCCKAQKNY